VTDPIEQAIQALRDAEAALAAQFDQVDPQPVAGGAVEAVRTVLDRHLERVRQERPHLAAYLGMPDRAPFDRDSYERYDALKSEDDATGLTHSQRLLAKVIQRRWTDRPAADR
jgi:hypothetical protein